jgi:DNA replication protein DnaC
MRGTGKTQLGVCAIKEVSIQGRLSLYCKAFDFFLDIRDKYKKGSEESEKSTLVKYLKPSLLVIDAVENRSDSPWENLLLNHMIDLRYDAVLDTVMITNQVPKQIEATMGPSIVSRANENGLVLECKWESFRGKK